MSNYSATFVVPQPPPAAFDAINDVPSWWSGNVEGTPTSLGAEFTYSVPGVHFCRMKVTEFVPGKSIAWRVVDSNLTFTEDKSEWTGTVIRFELRNVKGETELQFTHEGLGPELECFDGCSSAWSMLVGNLRRRITSGQPQPNVFAKNA